MDPLIGSGKLRERQYQLLAQKRNEAAQKLDYHKQTARYFMRECDIARHYQSWNKNVPSPLEYLEKVRKAERLKARKSALKKLLEEEERNYEKEVENLKLRKKHQFEDFSLDALREKLQEKRAEQSLYYPQTCRKYRRSLCSNLTNNGFASPQNERFFDSSRKTSNDDSLNDSQETKENRKINENICTSLYESESPPYKPNPKFRARYSRRSLENTNVSTTGTESSCNSSNFHSRSPSAKFPRTDCGNLVNNIKISQKGRMAAQSESRDSQNQAMEGRQSEVPAIQHGGTDRTSFYHTKAVHQVANSFENERNARFEHYDDNRVDEHTLIDRNFEASATKSRIFSIPQEFAKKEDSTMPTLVSPVTEETKKGQEMDENEKEEKSLSSETDEPDFQNSVEKTHLMKSKFTNREDAGFLTPQKADDRNSGESAAKDSPKQAHQIATRFSPNRHQNFTSYEREEYMKSQSAAEKSSSKVETEVLEEKLEKELVIEDESKQRERDVLFAEKADRDLLEDIYEEKCYQTEMKKDHVGFERERSFPWMRMNPREQNLSEEMFLYLTHAEGKRQMQDLENREYQACTGQRWDEALRLRDMRNKLELSREKQIYHRADLKIDEAHKKLGLESIRIRQQFLVERENVCSNSNIYSEEAREIWNQWEKEDNMPVIKESREQREILLRELEKEWKMLADEDKKRVSRTFQKVMTDSSLQDELAVSAALKAAANQ